MKEKIKKIVTTIVILLIALLLLVGIYWYMKSHERIEIDDNARKYEANIQRPEDWGEGRIAVPGYGEIQMEEDGEYLPVALYNPSENPCYFVFHVTVEGQELYKSKLVPPGEAITNAKLSKKISKGTHEVTIKIDTYDLSDGKTQMNGSEVKAKIITYSK